MGRPCENSKKYEDICSKIDELMKRKYENANNYNDPKFKEAANNLIENYFEIITKEKAEKYFSFTFSNKESIILNVLYDKKARKNMAELGKLYGNDAIPKLLKNPKLIQSIVNGEIDDNIYIKKNII